MQLKLTPVLKCLSQIVVKLEYKVIKDKIKIIMLIFYAPKSQNSTEEKNGYLDENETLKFVIALKIFYLNSAFIFLLSKS